MKATLICARGCRHKLTWTTDHPASHYGLGVMIGFKGNVFSGAGLHSDPRGRIETNDPEKVCRALGIPYPDSQVVEKAK